MKKLIPYIVILGTIMFAINLIFNSSVITFIQTMQDNRTGMTYYKLDILGYFNNLQYNLTNSDLLYFELPQNIYYIILQDIVSLNFLGAIAHGITTVINYIIMVINILIYPLRVGAYLVKNILGIIGFNTYTEDTNNSLYWLADFIRQLERTMIPYINY